VKVVRYQMIVSESMPSESSEDFRERGRIGFSISSVSFCELNSKIGGGNWLVDLKVRQIGEGFRYFRWHFVEELGNSRKTFVWRFQVVLKFLAWLNCCFDLNFENCSILAMTWSQHPSFFPVSLLNLTRCIDLIPPSPSLFTLSSTHQSIYFLRPKILLKLRCQPLGSPPNPRNLLLSPQSSKQAATRASFDQLLKKITKNVKFHFRSWNVFVFDNGRQKSVLRDESNCLVSLFSEIYFSMRGRIELNDSGGRQINDKAVKNLGWW
jgi:hypothetical protein